MNEQQISFDDLLQIAKGNSATKEEAITTLCRFFAEDVEVWKILVEAYENGQISVSNFLCNITYAFSHPDLFRRQGQYQFGIKSKEYVTEYIKKCSVERMIDFLSCVEDEIARGTMGQTVEIVISHIDDKDDKLLTILSNSSNDYNVRYFAEAILAYKSPDFYVEKIEEIETVDAEFTSNIISQINEFGSVDFY